MRPGHGDVPRSRARSVTWVLGWPLVSAIGACGGPNPEVEDVVVEARPAPRRDRAAATEPEKIRALLDAVRHSEHMFVMAGQARPGPEAADDLERRLVRTAAGVPTARRFIERIGPGTLRAGEVDTVRLREGGTLPMQEWLTRQLARLEGVTAASPTETAATGVAPEPRTEPGILDALKIVDGSGLRFIAPARRTAKGEVKGKAKEYSASEFASMLRNKWEFLGKDIDDLDTFVEVIATDAFATMAPYRVRLGDGSEQVFRSWLDARLDERRRAYAHGEIR